jgi:hypothetical protein
MPSPTHIPLPPIPVVKSYAQQRFENFHLHNKHVYNKLVELSRLAKRMGRDRYSIKSLWEQLRWHYLVERNDAAFKLNNDYHSRYARLIMSKERDLRGFFEIRTLTTE